MNIIVTILPILLIILFGIYLLNKKMSFSLKVTHWIATIYCSVLLIASVIVPLQAKTADSIYTPLSEKEVALIDADFYKNLSEKNIDILSEKYLINEKNLPYNLETLQISHSGFNSPQVIINQKRMAKQIITIKSFRSGVFINGLDYSDEVQEFQYELINNQLIIHSPNETRIEVAATKREFTINMFLGGGIINNEIFSRSNPYIYIEIPHNIDLELDSDLDIF